jgi:hypothetical protein
MERRPSSRLTAGRCPAVAGEAPGKAALARRHVLAQVCGDSVVLSLSESDCIVRALQRQQNRQSGRQHQQFRARFLAARYAKSHIGLLS